jgi:hypothetical protein
MVVFIFTLLLLRQGPHTYCNLSLGPIVFRELILTIYYSIV